MVVGMLTVFLFLLLMIAFIKLIESEPITYPAGSRATAASSKKPTLGNPKSRPLSWLQHCCVRSRATATDQHLINNQSWQKNALIHGRPSAMVSVRVWCTCSDKGLPTSAGSCSSGTTHFEAGGGARFQVSFLPQRICIRHDAPSARPSAPKPTYKHLPGVSMSLP